jgi:toxin FitB
MIILDTNVVSEPMRLRAKPAVAAWLDQQILETLYLTSVSLAELLAGVEILPAGRKKRELAAGLEELIDSLFGTRILPFDDKAAKAFAELIGKTRKSGLAISISDGQIAAIAKVHGFSVASRDTSPFAAAGISVIDPWMI